MTGKLYLLPVPLGPSLPEAVLPAPTLERTRQLRYFVVENAKSARAFLKSVNMPVPLQTLQLSELNEHTRKDALPALLQPLLAGHDLGMLSEAGCPAIADPGADLAALAQAQGIRVIPLVGPSSLLLALMASGLNGQCFAFHGYLPARDTERKAAIRQLEKESRDKRQTQVFIETPYRNKALFLALLAHGAPATRLCLATDLTLASESIRTKTLAEWQRLPPPDLDRRPTCFLMLAV
jgi:16S rRNA (cytidine1402-2'-O)-methyltransferase